MPDSTEQLNTLPRKTLFGFGRRKSGTPKATPVQLGVPPINDPDNPDASIRAQDLKNFEETIRVKGLPDPSSSEYKRIVENINNVYKEARDSRARRAQRWELCQRYYEGDQWIVIDERRGVIDPRQTNDELERSVTLNHITYIVERLVSYLTQNDPQVQPLALIDTPLHKQAAEEADALAGKMYRDHDVRALRKAQIRNAMTTTTSYRYWQWNPRKTDLVPDIDPETGQVVGAQKVPIGGLEVQVLRGTDVYWEAAADSMANAYQCVIARVKPLAWLQETYGKAAYGVQADTVADRGETDLPYLDTDGRLISGRTGRTKKDAALTLEWIVRPRVGGRYPNGLYVVMANNRILYQSEWPWADKENWPMSELQWMPRAGSPYGFGLVEFLEPAQTLINREFSRIAARLDKDKRMVFIQKLSGVGPADFEELRDLYKVYYNAGSAPPTISNMPPINDQHFQLIDRCVAYMEKISGMVDVLKGDVPMSQMSGVLYDLMMEAATTTLAPFMQEIGRNEVDFLRGAISEYTEKGSPLIMMGLDPRGNKPVNPTNAAFNMTALEALTDGGKVELYLNPTSGLLKSPAGQQKEVDEKFQMGLFGIPGSPESLKMYWQLSNNPLSQKVLAIMDQQQQEAAQQPQPDPVDMQKQIDDNKEQARLEREMELARLKHNLAIQKAQADAHVQAALGDSEDAAEISKSQQQAQMDAQLSDQESRNAMSMADQSHQQEMQRLMAQHALDSQRALDEHSRKVELARMQQAHTAKIAMEQMKHQSALAKITKANKPAPSKKK